jgi:hypothetical protein
MSRAPPCAPFPGRQRHRTYYQVLGISPDERDPRVIEEAALGCSCRTRAYQLSRESECSLRLNEIALALSTLLDPVRRREYDRSLARLRRPAAWESRPARCEIKISRERTLVLRIREEQACDVKLVYRRCILRQPARRTG